MSGHPVIGRDDELESLSDFLAMGEAEGLALLLQGEAGIGKTTIFNAALADAETRGYRTVSCRPAASETAFAFAALGDLLAPWISETLPALPPAQRRALEVALLLSEPGEQPSDLHAVALAFLAALHVLGLKGGVLLAIDDVQWLDRSSAAVLEFVVRRLRLDRIVVLVAQRTEAAGADPLGLDRAFPELRRIRLGPLDASGLHELVRSRLGAPLPRPMLLRLLEASGGNPFYALEIARALANGARGSDATGRLPIPADLQQLVRGRISGLPEDVQDVLAAVAALSEATVSTVQAVSPDPDGAFAALAAAADGGLVALDDEAVVFTHPLLSDAAYSRLSPARRRELHRRLAAVMPSGEERAHHLALGMEGADAALARELEEAASIAAMRGAVGAAAELLEQAGRATPSDMGDERVRRRTEAASLHLLGGDSAYARTILEELVASLPPGIPRARALNHLAETREDDHDVPMALWTQALGEAAGDDLLIAEIERELTQTCTLRGELEAGLVHARAALDAAGRAGDPDALEKSLSMAASVETMSGSITPGLLERGLEIELGLDRPAGFRSATGTHAIRLVYEDRLDEARDLLDQVYRRSVDIGDAFERPPILVYLTQVEWLAGNWPRAERSSSEGLETAEQLGLPQTELSLRCMCGFVDALLGRVDSARARISPCLSEARQMKDQLWETRSRAALGFLELSVGDPAAAEECLGAMPPLATRTPPSAFRFLPDRIEALVQLGEVSTAGELLELLADGLHDIVSPWRAAVSARCEGLVKAAEGDLPGALSAFERAAVAHDALGYPFERARTLLVQGSTLRRAKHKQEARETLEAALAIFEELGAVLWAEKARAELARIPGRRPTASSELTETERRIAERVAQGESNKAVAAALFVSVRTVESNLSRVYAKLGVRSRTELATRLPAR
jgi:DNA-binding CsgD family transcriptional regulator